MNKQELIERIEGLKNIFGNKSEYVKIDTVIELISELDEPQKVKVPPAVSVWYQINKDNLDKNIAYLCLNNWGEFINDKTLFNWMSNTDNFIQILVNMHQFGYEVEEEKRYRVKFIQTGQHLAKNIFPKSEYFVIKTSAISSTDNFTRKELEEANFGWVFDCEGIEVEEVKD